MKFLENRRGQIRILEAFFASILILSCLALVPSQRTGEKSHFNTLYSVGTQVLTTLDSNGTLSKLIENKNWTVLRNCIQTMLPVSIWFNLTVFNGNMICLNDVLISNGSPISDEIVAVEYVCASSGGNYIVYIVRLQLATAK
jgi:hypothetical protein